MKLDIDQGHSFEEFLKNLSETVAWCSSRPKPWNPIGTFRSPEIAPEFGSSTYKDWVSSVAWQRQSILGGTAGLPDYLYMRGKILVYFPDENLCHGLEESETEGFVTVDNVPPWDTWIAYIYTKEENFLLSWVPDEFVNLVNSGIEVSPEECFNWLGIRAPDFKKEIEKVGIKIERNT